MSLKIHRQIMQIARKDGLPMSLAAWSLLQAMVDRANDSGNSIHAAMTTIGSVAHLKRTAVFEAKSELVELGLILPSGKMKHRNGYTGVYKINLDLLNKLESDPSVLRTSLLNEPLRNTNPSAKRTDRGSPNGRVPVRQTDTKQSLKQSKKQSEEKAASAASSASNSKSESPQRGDIQQESVKPKVKVPAKKKRFNAMAQFKIAKPYTSKFPVKPFPVPAKKESVPDVPSERKEFWQTWTDDLEDAEGIIPADSIRRAIRYHSDPECPDQWYNQQGWSKRLVKSNARRMVDAVPFDFDPDRPKPVKINVLQKLKEKSDPNCKKCRGEGMYTIYIGCSPKGVPCEICHPKLAAWVARDKAA